MRSFCCCLVVLAGLLPSEPVWRGLRWDMPIGRASQTLSRQGLKVREQRVQKSATTYLSTNVDGWHATVYFDEQGRMDQITVIAETLTREAAAAAKARLTKRFGAVKDTRRWTRQTWGSTKLLVVHIPDEGWLAREEYERPDAGGPVGAFDLTWGQAAPDVEQRLRAAGFEARTAAMSIDPCTMPSPPPDCEPDASVVVDFKKGDDEGSANVHKKRGLVQITFTAKVASYADGLARAKPIEALHGSASEIEEATITTWSDATSDASLDVREKKPKGTLSAIESYRPPGRER